MIRLFILENADLAEVMASVALELLNGLYFDPWIYAIRETRYDQIFYWSSIITFHVRLYSMHNYTAAVDDDFTGVSLKIILKIVNYDEFLLSVCSMHEVWVCMYFCDLWSACIGHEMIDPCMGSPYSTFSNNGHTMRSVVYRRQQTVHFACMVATLQALLSVLTCTELRQCMVSCLNLFSFYSKLCSNKNIIRKYLGRYIVKST